MNAIKNQIKNLESTTEVIIDKENIPKIHNYVPKKEIEKIRRTLSEGKFIENFSLH